ncbi:TIGR01777 family oxidoreductase [uncultured Umboniibacter sp.]|uniref:TIGR01777 family oxidoreductase n=1 Tax=uncultured Umboniibacter sp. TaxID=1798917 RepID=UPI00262E3E55|nr:TIGR01777 family oxidoreductase [uncultured Umboniibacter sp.]
MHYLITGGTGFVGTALIAALPDSSAISVLTRKKSQQSTSPNITYINNLEELASAPDAVINLAGEPIFGLWSERKKQSIISSRVEATEDLVSYLNQFAPQATLVSASAVGYYSHSSLKHPTDLDSPAASNFAGTLCCRWEQAARKFNGTAHIARLGVILGDGGYLKQLILPTKMGLAMHLGSGDQGVPWVHIEDVVRGIITLSQKSTESTELVLVAPAQNSHADINNALAARLNRKVRLKVPHFLVRFMGGSMANELILNGHYFQPAQLTNQLSNFEQVNLAAAIATIIED